jgi:hypothetical protein
VPQAGGSTTTRILRVLRTVLCAGILCEHCCGCGSAARLGETEEAADLADELSIVD